MVIQTPPDLIELAGSLLSEGKLGDFLKSVYTKAAPVNMPRVGPLGPIFRRPMEFPDVGSTVLGHFHNFDHITVVFAGGLLARFVKVGPDGKPTGEIREEVFRVKDGGFEILIRADTWHEFISLEPGTRATCYFPHRGWDGEIVADYNGNLHSYA